MSQGFVTTERGPAMQLFSGKPFFPLDPKAEDICIGDIAEALSKLCRYNGHIREFYSVAQHSVILSYLVPEEDALTALLHDATEAYVGDMVRPLKSLFPEFSEIEHKIWEVIAQKYHLKTEFPASIKDHDFRICFTERRDLLNYTGETDWGDEMTPHDITITAQAPHTASFSFHKRFDYLWALHGGDRG